MRDPGDACISLCDSLGRVDQHETDIRAIHGRDGTNDGVTLDIIVDLSLPAKTRRIDEGIFLSVMHDLRIDRVTGRAGNVGDDHAVLAQQLIDHGALSDIRLTDEGDLHRIILVLFCRLDREVPDHLIEHVTDTELVYRGYTERIAEPQIIELIDIISELLEAVDLIDAENDRLSGLPEHIRHLIVCIDETGTHIHDENDDIRRIDCQLRLRTHLRQDDILGIRLDTTRIDQRKLVIQPLRIRIDTVTGHTRRILHDGDLLPCNQVEQRRLTYVWTAHHRHHHFSHIFTLLRGARRPTCYVLTYLTK